MTAQERRALGGVGEQIAERALLERGWRVCDRNARTRYGEIDLVCHDGRAFVFVEVKTRSRTSFVAPIEAVHGRKLGRLVRLAQAWLALHDRRNAAWRLAVAALTVGPEGTDVRIVDVGA